MIDARGGNQSGVTSLEEITIHPQLVVIATLASIQILLMKPVRKDNNYGTIDNVLPLRYIIITAILMYIR